MADKTSIEWTDATWNPIRARNLGSSSAERDSPSSKSGGIGHFCVHVSEGCRYCYAERLQPRFRNPVRFAAQDRDKVEIYLDEDVLLQPLRWKRPRRIFPCSMTDLFGDWVTDEWLDRIFAVMALSPQHTFQPLTKRAERMRDYVAALMSRERSIMTAAYKIDSGIGLDQLEAAMPELFDTGSISSPIPNVWLGVSVEDQKTADERIPLLLQTPAAKRVISAEPLLGPIDIAWALSRNRMEISAGFLKRGLFSPGIETLRPLDQVITGGESGSDRPTHPDWIRSLRDQCVQRGTAFFFKQWGSCLPGGFDGEDENGNIAYLIDEEHSSVDYDALGNGRCVFAHGREFVRFPHNNTGRTLDGLTWDEFPT